LTQDSSAELIVEREGSSGGVCECCGYESQSVWGFVHNDAGTIAAYFAHWTVGHLDDHPSNLDFVVGPWGDGTTQADRTVVSLLYKLVDGNREVMVTDAREERIGTLASTGLKREEIIGTPLAPQIFDLVDAIWAQDELAFAG
jgi:hypothetical protein